MQTPKYYVRYAKLPRFPRKIPFIIINICGVMGSGKTNWIYFLYKKYNYEKRSNVISIYSRFILNKSEELFNLLREIDKDYRNYRIFIALDDISFEFMTLSAETREFLNRLTKLRHDYCSRARQIILVNAIHYSRATIPMLRISPIKIITSILSAAEIEMLKDHFDYSSLWDYYTMYIQNPEDFYTLINWYGKQFITKIGKERKPKWDYEI